MTPAAPGQLFPLTALQRSMVRASIRAPGSGVYIVQDVCELPGSVDIGLLRRAWSIVSQRHPALRTSIEFSGGNVTWRGLDEEPEICWQELDWTGLSPGIQQTQLPELLRQDRVCGFDFQAGIPMRFAVLRTSFHSCTLIWTSHHALLDGRSYTAVWREWLAVYDRLVEGDEIRPAEPAVADDGPRYLEPQDRPRAEQYWRNYFEGLPQTVRAE